MKCSYCNILCANRFCNRCLNARNQAIENIIENDYIYQKNKNTTLYQNCKKQADENNIYNDWTDKELEEDIKYYFKKQYKPRLEITDEIRIKQETLSIIGKTPELTNEEVELIEFWRSLTKIQKAQINGYFDYFKKRYLSKTQK